MMKSFLLILSLMAGCEASTEDSTEVKGCRDGWVEFYCKYPKENERYQEINVEKEKTEIRSTQKDQWENKGRYSLYHDTKNKRLKVAIKQLQQENFGKYECEFYKDQNSSDEDEVEVKVEAEEDGCQQQFNQTAYKTAKTTITCDYPENKHSSSDKFFCRENNFTCEEILSTNSSVKSNGTFTLTETNSGFSVSISNVSSYDAGLYWCGVNKGNYRTGLRKIQLKVEGITTFTRSPAVGQNFTYWCEYPKGALIKKFICKGEDPSICQSLVNTAQQNMNTRFSMKDDKVKRNITITVREVTAEDSGTYWCGAESTDTRRSNTFFHRFLMTVGSSWLTATIVGVICVVVLALLLIVLFFYKRLHSKTTRDGEAKNIREDRTYEEIQELPQKPDSGTALKTIYVTANFPTNPSSAPHHPSNINFQSSSGDVGGDTYCTVRDGDQPPTYSTVNQPSRSSADPFYSTVNKPQ